MILDTNALSAYLDKTAAAVEIVSEATEVAVPVLSPGSSLSVSPSPGNERHTNHRCSECWTDASSLTLELIPRGAAGTPIPANDVWLAALSRQHAMPVMSRDGHFDFVAGLRRRTW